MQSGVLPHSIQVFSCDLFSRKFGTIENSCSITATAYKHMNNKVRKDFRDGAVEPFE
jgi:hypothetical protein